MPLTEPMVTLRYWPRALNDQCLAISQVPSSASVANGPAPLKSAYCGVFGISRDGFGLQQMQAHASAQLEALAAQEGIGVGQVHLPPVELRVHRVVDQEGLIADTAACG